MENRWKINGKWQCWYQNPMENQWKTTTHWTLGTQIPHVRSPPSVLSAQDRSDSLQSWDKKSRLGNGGKHCGCWPNESWHWDLSRTSIWYNVIIDFFFWRKKMWGVVVRVAPLMQIRRPITGGPLFRCFISWAPTIRCEAAEVNSGEPGQLGFLKELQESFESQLRST